MPYTNSNPSNTKLLKAQGKLVWGLLSAFSLGHPCLGLSSCKDGRCLVIVHKATNHKKPPLYV